MKAVLAKAGVAKPSWRRARWSGEGGELLQHGRVVRRFRLLGPAVDLAWRCHDAPQNTGKLKILETSSKKKFITFRMKTTAALVNRCASGDRSTTGLAALQQEKNRLNTLSIGLRILPSLLLLWWGSASPMIRVPRCLARRAGWRGAARVSFASHPTPRFFADTAIVQVYASGPPLRLARLLRGASGGSSTSVLATPSTPATTSSAGAWKRCGAATPARRVWFRGHAGWSAPRRSVEAMIRADRRRWQSYPHTRTSTAAIGPE